MFPVKEMKLRLALASEIEKHVTRLRLMEIKATNSAYVLMYCS